MKERNDGSSVVICAGRNFGSVGDNSVDSVLERQRGVPMTRIERAARAMYAGLFHPDMDTMPGIRDRLQAEAFREVKRGLVAAYPELHADPTTHWIAPVEATGTMLGEAWTVPRRIFEEEPDYSDLYRAMRDAYLKETG